VSPGSTLRPERHQPGSLSPDLPWAARDLTALLRLGLLGLVAIAVGWIGSSGTVVLSRQAGWVGAAVMGNLMAGAAMVGWLLAGLRSVRQLKQEVVADLDARWPESTALDTSGGDLSGLVSLAGARRYHRAGCHLVAGKPTRVAAASAHHRAGRQPCGVCVRDSA
jgi:hypothetical protein